MDFNAILLLLAASLAITSSQKLPPRAIASIMQEILSPKTTEQFADAIRGAANSRTPLAELLANRKRNIVSEAGLARNFARKEVLQEAGMPRKDKNIQQVIQPKVILQKPNEIVLPKKVAVRNSIPNNIAIQKSNDVVNLAMQNANEMPTKTKIVIKKPELATKKVLVQNPEGNKRILVDKANAIPMLRNLLLQIDNTIASKGLHPKTLVVKEVPRVESEIKPVPTVLVQKSGTSPLTTTSTVSNALPQSRGQFLRKIPIPPPTI